MIFPHKSHIWEKSGSWDMSQNALIFKSTISNKMIRPPDFLQVDANLWILKVDWKLLGWACSKKGCSHSHFERTLKLAVQQDGIKRNKLFYCGLRSIIVSCLSFKKIFAPPSPVTPHNFYKEATKLFFVILNKTLQKLIFSNYSGLRKSHTIKIAKFERSYLI